ncbi:hypothetical protein WBG78_00620 [Chryseolinea sp. T2]|uniref:hypothetical protein n=1 Tax=Chryseolinea sp. T2 TaxID=3129255 RepID=UPI0030788632
MKAKNLVSIIFCSLLLITCDDNDHVDYPDLHMYVQRFTDEARARGWNIDHNIVEAAYVNSIDIDSRDYCGIGWYDYKGTGKRRMEISQSCGWATNSEDDRDVLVFHELGHAILNRTHTDLVDCDGAEISFMNWKAVLPHYNSGDEETRKYYIDELFDQLAARDKCIYYGQDFKQDPRFYEYFDTDQSWFFYSSNNRYTGLRTQSLLISSTDKNTSESGYWQRTFEAPPIPNCAEVTLRMKINSPGGLTGKGAAIAVRAYENEIRNSGAITKQTQFFTTEDSPVTGVLNDHVEELVIPCLSMKTTHLVIIAVMMPEQQER